MILTWNSLRPLYYTHRPDLQSLPRCWSSGRPGMEMNERKCVSNSSASFNFKITKFISGTHVQTCPHYHCAEQNPQVTVLQHSQTTLFTPKHCQAFSGSTPIWLYQTFHVHMREMLQWVAGRMEHYSHEWIVYSRQNGTNPAKQEPGLRSKFHHRTMLQCHSYLIRTSPQ